VYKKYREKEKGLYIERLKENKPLKTKRKDINRFTSTNLETPKFLFELNSNTFVSCMQIPKAVEYCRSRKIPEHVIRKLKYCVRDGLPFSDMIIFPLYYDEKLVYGFQGRSYKEKRFNTYMPNDNYKVYNYFHVDKSKPVYVFESIIDSNYIENSIAMLGADLNDEIRKKFKKLIYVFDNDRTGEEKTLKYILEKEKCVIWPDPIKSKDIGDLVEKGIDISKIQLMLENNIYSGLNGEALIKIKLSKSKKTYKRKKYESSI
jgi:DNA primase